MLYAAFLHFCVRPRLNIDLLTAAMDTAGATSLPILNVSNGYPMRQAHWQVPFHRHTLIVEAHSQYRPDIDPPQFSQDCNIFDREGDVEAAEAIAKWANVPRLLASEDSPFGHYAFQEKNGVHVPCPSATLFDKQGIWRLNLAGSKGGVLVSLGYQRPETR